MNDPVWSSRTPIQGTINEQHIQTIPANHGVVCVRDANQGVIALAASGDVRSFLGARLGTQAEGAQDLRPVARTYEIMPCHSMFEADLAFMRESALLDRGLHDRVTRKLRIWWLGTHVDVRRAEWALETDPDVFEPSMRVIGPFLEKKGARRHAECLDNTFELCRYPNQLHKAPHGAACAYKEMGKCPAACDGSEPIDSYEARLIEALGFDADAAMQKRTAIESRMTARALDEDFEGASRCKAELAQFDAFDARLLNVVGELSAHAYAAVTPSGRSGVACVLGVARGRWTRLGELEIEGGLEASEAMTRDALSTLEAMRAEVGCGNLGVLGVLGRELLRPSRGGPGFVRIDRLDGSILLQAARRALGVSSGQHTDRSRNAQSDE